MGLLVKYLFFIYISGKGNFIFHVKASLIGCFSLTPPGLSSASLEIKDAGNGLNGMLYVICVLVSSCDLQQ